MHQIYKADFQEMLDTNVNMYLVLLQVRSTPLGSGLPNTAALLFNHPIRGIMSVINRSPINPNNDDGNYGTLVA